MKILFTLISIIILISSCSFGKDSLENNKENEPGKVKVETSEETGSIINDKNVEVEESEKKPVEKIKDNIDKKESKTINKEKNTVSGTGNEDDEQIDETEEKIVEDFETELDDIFKSLEGYE